MNLGSNQALPKPRTSPDRSTFLHPALEVMCRMSSVGLTLAIKFGLHTVSPIVDPVSSKIKSRRSQVSSSEVWLCIIRLHQLFFLVAALLLLDLALDEDSTEASSLDSVWAWAGLAVGVRPVSLNQVECSILSFKGQWKGVWSGDPQQWHLKLEFVFLFWTKLVPDVFVLDSDDGFDLDLERSFSDASEFTLNRESKLWLWYIAWKRW